MTIKDNEVQVLSTEEMENIAGGGSGDLLDYIVCKLKGHKWDWQSSVMRWDQNGDQVDYETYRCERCDSLLYNKYTYRTGKRVKISKSARSGPLPRRSLHPAGTGSPRISTIH